MKKAKVRSLSVRPYKSTDLAFPYPGLLRLQSAGARLGARVTGFDLDGSVVPQLNDVIANGPDNGRIKQDSGGIATLVGSHALFGQSNGRHAAELDQAIANHLSDYLEKYSNASAIATTMRSENGARINDFTEMQALLTQRHTALSKAYQKDGCGVLTEITSESKHLDDTPPVVRTYSAPMQLLTPGYVITIKGGGMAADMTHTVPEVQVNPKGFRGGAFQSVTEELTVDLAGARPAIKGMLTQVSETVQKPVITTNQLPEYAHPSLDEDIGKVAMLGDLHTEHSERLIRAHRLKHLERIFANEEIVSRLEVKKRQFALMDTYLLAPFDGVITAIYKDVGEYVQAGEPVMRIENDEKLLLVGFIQCKGMVSVDDIVNFKVNNIFESGETLSMTGKVVAVRGHDADDDEWDVAIEIPNEQGQLLERKDKTTVRIRPPLNLQIDKYETEITFN